MPAARPEPILPPLHLAALSIGAADYRVAYAMVGRSTRRSRAVRRGLVRNGLVMARHYLIGAAIGMGIIVLARLAGGQHFAPVLRMIGRVSLPLLALAPAVGLTWVAILMVRLEFKRRSVIRRVMRAHAVPMALEFGWNREKMGVFKPPESKTFPIRSLYAWDEGATHIVLFPTGDSLFPVPLAQLDAAERDDLRRCLAGSGLAKGWTPQEAASGQLKGVFD